VVAAWDCADLKTTTCYLCHLFVATGSEAKNTATKHSSSTSACLTRTKADAGMRSTFRKHFEGAPTNYHAESRSSHPGGAITKHSVHVPDNADITIHAETSPGADWL
jgi:hypothetical protein